MQASQPEERWLVACRTARWVAHDHCSCIHTLSTVVRICERNLKRDRVLLHSRVDTDEPADGLAAHRCSRGTIRRDCWPVGPSIGGWPRTSPGRRRCLGWRTSTWSDAGCFRRRSRRVWDDHPGLRGGDRRGISDPPCAKTDRQRLVEAPSNRKHRSKQSDVMRTHLTRATATRDAVRLPCAELP